MKFSLRTLASNTNENPISCKNHSKPNIIRPSRSLIYHHHQHSASYVDINCFPKIMYRIESVIIFQGGLARAISLGFMIVSIVLMMFIAFSVYTGSGGILTPKKVFTVLSLLTVLKLTSVQFMVLNALSISEGRVALTRIQVSWSLHGKNSILTFTIEIRFIDVCTYIVLL